MLLSSAHLAVLPAVILKLVQLEKVIELLLVDDGVLVTVILKIVVLPEILFSVSLRFMFYP